MMHSSVSSHQSTSVSAMQQDGFSGKVSRHVRKQPVRLGFIQGGFVMLRSQPSGAECNEKSGWSPLPPQV